VTSRICFVWPGEDLLSWLEQSPVSIVITDINGIIEYVNKKFIDNNDIELNISLIKKNRKGQYNDLVKKLGYREIVDILYQKNSNNEYEIIKYTESEEFNIMDNIFKYYSEGESVFIQELNHELYEPKEPKEGYNFNGLLAVVHRKKNKNKFKEHLIPLRIAIIDKATEILMNMCRKIQLSGGRVLAVKIDSITFVRSEYIRFSNNPNSIGFADEEEEKEETPIIEEKKPYKKVIVENKDIDEKYRNFKNFVIRDNNPIEEVDNNIIIEDDPIIEDNDINNIKQLDDIKLCLSFDQDNKKSNNNNNYLVNDIVNSVNRTDKYNEPKKEVKYEPKEEITHDKDVYIYPTKKIVIDINPLNFKSWKHEAIKAKDAKLNINKYDIKQNEIYYDIKNTELIEIEETEKILSYGTLFDCYAGSGKTYYIIHTLLQEIIKHGLSYIIVSPKHSALSEYYEKEYNAKVIQYFTHANQTVNNIFSSYDYVIVDECGLLDNSQYEYIYKNIGINTVLLCFGDSDQLLPYGMGYNKHPLLNDLIVNKLFKYKVCIKSNFRNTYTNEEYDNMMKLKYELKEFELNKFGIIADINICIKNVTCDEINNKIVETLGASKHHIDEERFIYIKNGMRFISDFNDVKSYKKLGEMGLYNSCFYEVINFDNTQVTIQNGNKKINVPYITLYTHFKYGYAITLYKAQGLSIPYNKIGFHDIDMIKKNGRFLYTALSRIQTLKNGELNKEYLN